MTTSPQSSLSVCGGGQDRLRRGPCRHRLLPWSRWPGWHLYHLQQCRKQQDSHRLLDPQRDPPHPSAAGGTGGCRLDSGHRPGYVSGTSTRADPGYLYGALLSPGTVFHDSPTGATTSTPGATSNEGRNATGTGCTGVGLCTCRPGTAASAVGAGCTLQRRGIATDSRHPLTRCTPESPSPWAGSGPKQCWDTQGWLRPGPHPIILQ